MDNAAAVDVDAEVSNEELANLMITALDEAELRPSMFPQGNDEFSDALKLKVARAAFDKGRIYTAFRILVNLKSNPLKRGKATETRQVRKYLEANP